MSEPAAPRNPTHSLALGMPVVMRTIERMCRSIKTLYNYDPVATDDEVQAAALQYVRKISGYREPSRANRDVFDRAVDAVAEVTRTLVDELVTAAPPKNREVEAAKARQRAADRYRR